MARDTGEFLGRRAELNRENAEEDLVECNESKGDGMYQMVKLYEEGVIKFKHRLHNFIQILDGPLTFNTSWENAEILGTPFNRIL